MRLVLILVALLAAPFSALAEPTFFPARDGNADAPVLVVNQANAAASLKNFPAPGGDYPDALRDLLAK